MKNLIIISILILLPGLSQAQVSISLQQPPPFRFSISSMWNVTLVNASGGDMNVYLHGQASKTGEGLVLEATTSVFILQPGVRTSNASQIQPIDVNEANQIFKNYKI